MRETKRMPLRLRQRRGRSGRREELSSEQAVVRAKIAMATQSLISLVILGLVIARAVNVLT
jgi:hypothetical protein